jgi:hypothetical protein
LSMDDWASWTIEGIKWMEIEKFLIEIL